MTIWDATAAEHYNKLLEKNMHRERGMDQSHPNCPTLIRAREMNWSTFVSPPADSVMSMVREFYANLKVRHESYQVRIRGRMVSFSSRAINAMFSMPDYAEEHDRFMEFMGRPYPYQRVIETLCQPVIVWKLNNQGAPITFPPLH